MKKRRGVFRGKGPWSRLLILCLLLLLLLTVGCGQQQEGIPEAVQGKDGPGQAPETITVVDSIGREVQVPARIDGIACLCPESGHAMAMFGLGDKIIASTDGMKRDLLLTEMYPSIKDAAKPKTSGVINIEELLNSKPDLVFVKMDTAQSEAEMEKMDKVKIPFLVVDYSSIEGQQYAVEMMGKAVGNLEKAQKYNEYYQNCLERVRPRVEGIPPEQRVTVYHSVNEAVRTDAAGSLAAEWTQVAGAHNVSVGKELKLMEDKHYASLEQILLWDPEVILVSDPNVAGYIMSNEQWAPLRAIKEGKVWRLPNGVTRWGHHSSLETPLAILWTAQQLYPDLFAHIDMKSETKYFYEEFFNYPLTDELVDQILSGEGMRLAKN